MERFKIEKIDSVYNNRGQQLQAAIRVMNGDSPKADNNKGGVDIVIGGRGYQIKSNRATVCRGYDVENIRAEYGDVDGFIYGDVETYDGYIMTIDEFVEFARLFTEKSRESGKNGGTEKLRLNRKFEEQRKYLERLA